MEIIREVNDFWALKDMVWSGAVHTLDDIERAGKENEFMDFLEETFACGNVPTETDVNDFLWFEREYIYDFLGLDKNGELKKEDDEEEEEEED